MDDTAALRRFLEISRDHRRLAHALRGCHHVGLLGEEGVAEFLGPLQLVAHIFRDPQSGRDSTKPWGGEIARRALFVGNRRDFSLIETPSHLDLISVDISCFELRQSV
jgi:hypothetical protein